MSKKQKNKANITIPNLKGRFDHRSYSHNLSNCKFKPEKILGLQRDSNPWRCNALPTELWRPIYWEQAMVKSSFHLYFRSSHHLFLSMSSIKIKTNLKGKLFRLKCREISCEISYDYGQELAISLLNCFKIGRHHRRKWEKQINMN